MRHRDSTSIQMGSFGGFWRSRSTWNQGLWLYRILTTDVKCTNRDGFHIGGNMKSLLFAGLFTLFVSLSALGQNDAHIVAPADQKFGPFPNFPKCTQGAVLHGNPSDGHGVTVIAKATAGCRIPMHFHTPNEEVGII